MNRYVEIPGETIVEKPSYVERTNEVAKYVDRNREIHLDNVTENIRTNEKTVEKPVYVDVVLEKQVEYIVVKDVQVPTQKNVEVAIQTRAERPVIQEHENIQEFNVNANVVEVTEATNWAEENVEVEDRQLAQEIDQRKRDLESERSKNVQLKSQFDTIQREFFSVKQVIGGSEEQENFRLRSRYEELNARLRNFNEHKSHLTRKSMSRQRIQETVIQKNPKVDSLLSRLNVLVQENNSLVQQIMSKGESVKHSVQASATAHTSYKTGGHYTQTTSYQTTSSSVGRNTGSAIAASAYGASAYGASKAAPSFGVSQLTSQVVGAPSFSSSFVGAPVHSGVKTSSYQTSQITQTRQF